MSVLKYNVGDRVLIKSLDWYNQMLAIKDKQAYRTPSNGCECIGIWCGNRIFKNDMIKFCGQVMTIKAIENEYYIMHEDTSGYWYCDEMIECKVEEETKPQYEDEIELIGYSSPKQFICPIGYEFKDENGNVINATKIVLEKKKPKYPTTYEECCTILGFHYDHYLTYDDEKNLPVSQDESDFIDSVDAFVKLMICKKAYWKIAGEEMGLGKPWKPDYGDLKNTMYGLYSELKYSILNPSQFVFPTKEMRDAFYENFKEEIEFVRSFCNETLW